MERKKSRQRWIAQWPARMRLGDMGRVGQWTSARTACVMLRWSSVRGWSVQLPAGNHFYSSPMNAVPFVPLMKVCHFPPFAGETWREIKFLGCAVREKLMACILRILAPFTDIIGTKSINALPRSGGLEPYCAIVIAALLCTTSVLSLYVLRMMYRRRRRRRLTDKSLPPNQRPEYCYFNNNKKYECSTSIGSSTDMTPAVEKKLLCPNVSV